MAKVAGTFSGRYRHLQWLHSRHVEWRRRANFVAALGGVFEHSPWVAERAHERAPFDTVTDLFAAMHVVVSRATRDEKLALVRAHPDLAGKAARVGTPTARPRPSKAPSASTAVGCGFARFERLNQPIRTSSASRS